jgi:hypothetical protein
MGRDDNLPRTLSRGGEKMGSFLDFRFFIAAFFLLFTQVPGQGADQVGGLWP